MTVLVSWVWSSITCAGFMVVTLVSVVVFQPAAIQSFLIFVIPVAIQLALCGGLVCLIPCAPLFAADIRSLPRSNIIGLLAIVLSSLVAFLTLIPAGHRLFFDEDIYLGMGQSVFADGRALICHQGIVDFDRLRCASGGYNKEPPGWPVLLGLAFRVLPVTEATGFALNRSLFLASILFTFLTAKRMFGAAAGMYATAAFAWLPQGLVWASTTVAEPSAALFAVIVVYATLLASERQGTGPWIGVVTLAYAAATMRPESALVFPLIAALLACTGVVPRLGRYAPIVLVVSTLAVCLLVLHYATVIGESWGSPGARFAPEYFPKNFVSNTRFYAWDPRHPTVVTAAALVGLFTGGAARRKLGILVWFSLFAGVFLFFYAGSYNFGVDVRFAVVSYMPLCILGGVGLARIASYLHQFGPAWAANGIVVASLLVGCSSPMSAARTNGSEAWAARADHEASLLFAELVPRHALVITHHTGLFQMLGKSSILTPIVSGNRRLLRDMLEQFPRGVYFHYNVWCDYGDAVQEELCKKVLELGEWQTVAEHMEKDQRFVLFKLVEVAEEQVVE